MELIKIMDRLAGEAGRLRFGPPVTQVYNPLEYARAAHVKYLKLYGVGQREVVLLGMNPGPWGMAQTGIPFGEVNLVREWLGIEAQVDKPPVEHPKRPIRGFACPRSEISGKRIWSWARDAFRTAERFFARFFVANYCPLAFLEDSGRNRTPDKLPAAERGPLFTICDRALREMVTNLQARWVIGVGGFAERRARVALEGLPVKIGGVLHPSPANPGANANWSEKATAQLRDYGIKPG